MTSSAFDSLVCELPPASTSDPLLQLAKLPNLPRAHIRITKNVTTIMKSFGLNIPRGLYTNTNRR